MKKNLKAQFLEWFSEVKMDAKFFITFGVICGIIQIVGFRFFDKNQLGAELAFEQISFFSMMVLFIACLILEFVNFLLQRYFKKECLIPLLQTGWDRTTAISNVSGFTAFGLMLAMLFSGDLRAALVTFIFSLFCFGFSLLGITLKKYSYKAWMHDETLTACLLVSTALLVR